MEKEFFNVEDIVCAVLNGANDVAVWIGGNHSLGYYDEFHNWQDEGGSEQELAFVKAILVGQLRIHLSKAQETNLRNIIRWLQEDDVEIRFPA